jgi:hypothetical protein
LTSRSTDEYNVEIKISIEVKHNLGSKTLQVGFT